MKNNELINNSDILAQFLHSASDTIAVDTEFMREHTYYPQLCLLQLNSAGQTTCVDVMAFSDLSVFKQIWVSPSYQKILHSCRQDIEVLYLALGKMPQNIFDTQVAAAFCGLGEQLGYAALVERINGVQIDKSQTRTDWSRRPLSQKQLDYAAEDVVYLPHLQQVLTQKMQQKGVYEWFLQDCAQLASDAFFSIDAKQAYQRLKGYHKLSAQAKSAARVLSTWREQVAETTNRPREWILPNTALFAISLNMPQNAQQLMQLKEVSSSRHRNHIKRNSDAIIAKLHSQERQQLALRPEENAYTPLTSMQKQRLKKCVQLVQATAERLDISAALLSNRKTLEAYVRGQEDLPVFSGWRAQVIGQALAEI